MKLRHLEIEIDASALQRPEINMPIATKLLAQLESRFGGHPILMASGYNAGPGAAKKWRKGRKGEPIGFFAEDIPYRGTRHYSRHVTGSFGLYQWLWGDSMLVRWSLTVP